MDFHKVTTQYKKQFIAGAVLLVLIVTGVAVYMYFFSSRQTGTLLELSPEEIARRLRNEGREVSQMSEEDRIRANPVEYVETLLPYYYAVRSFAIAEDWSQAELSRSSLAEGLTKWKEVSLADIQKTQIDTYLSATEKIREALSNKDLTVLEREYTELRYLEVMVLEYRKSRM